MSSNRRSLTNFAIIVAALALVVAASVTKGFGLFAEEPPAPSPEPPAGPAAIDLSCAEWRTEIASPIFGRIDEQPGIPGTATDILVSCTAAGFDEADKRIAMIRVDAESHGFSETSEYIAERGRSFIAAHCGAGATVQTAPERPHRASCTAGTDKYGGRAGWSDVRDHIVATIEITYYEPALLKDLAEAQSTTPDALLAATAAQVGQAVLALL